MQRRLFLLSGSATALSALAGCGGGGSGPAASAAAGTTAATESAAALTPPAGTASATPANTSTTSTPASQTPPDEATQTTADGAASGLPAKILACYYTTWDTARYALTDVPTDFNVIYLFHSKPNGTPVNGSYNNVGDGSFFFEHYSTVTATQVQACRQRGQRVILTVGGASAGYAWDNRTKSRNFVASFQGMYARLGGLDGIDFNNYEATILNTANVAAVSAEMVWIAQQLRALYGPGFAITSPPQPNDPNQQSLMSAMARAGVLSWAGPQFYDWSGFNASGYIAGRMNTWVGLVGGDASRALVGLSANYSNGPSLTDCVREWNAVKAAHPEIRGMFCWSAQTNLAGGNGWGSAMKTLL